MFVAFGGFFLGGILFLSLVRWLVLGAEAWSQSSTSTREGPPLTRFIVTVACQSLFHSAPWMVVAVAMFAYYVHSEPWAAWLFSGFLLNFGIMGMVTTSAYIAMRKHRRSGNAA
jgi:hypothetical protein